MIAGLILAGGQARRMGGADKALIDLAGQPLIAHVIARLRPQVTALAISANGDAARFSSLALPVLPDPAPDFPGPLAGILAGLTWARADHPQCRWLLTVPCDAPFIPVDLAERLQKAVQAEGADLAIATSMGQDHPVVGLWPLFLAEALSRALLDEGLCKVGAFAQRYRKALADFPAAEGIDPFINVNTPEDLKAALATSLEGPAHSVQAPSPTLR
ncbi:MAG: molybdenum cofactor guanylyltransferase MobA [Alphaproteobacteria bacterium]|nr:molybdenum cofactor guanylyltransferase MobA [Alphaproteobacteria bacterium]